MSVIILPIQMPPPKIEHRFEAATKGGRRIAITYTTQATEDERTVFLDLKNSLHPEAGAVSVKASEEMPPLGVAGVAALAWVVFCAGGLVFLGVASMAFGFDDAFMGSSIRPGSGWLGLWLLRGALVGVLVVPFLAWLAARFENKRCAITNTASASGE